MTLAALQGGKDPVMVVTPSYQTLADQAVFTQAMQLAILGEATDSIVFLSITPDHPATGYGYIKINATEASNPSQPSALVVDSFIEKPSSHAVQTYLDAGTY